MDENNLSYIADRASIIETAKTVIHKGKDEDIGVLLLEKGDVSDRIGVRLMLGKAFIAGPNMVMEDSYPKGIVHTTEISRFNLKYIIAIVGGVIKGSDAIERYMSELREEYQKNCRRGFYYANGGRNIALEGNIVHETGGIIGLKNPLCYAQGIDPDRTFFAPFKEGYYKKGSLDNGRGLISLSDIEIGLIGISEEMEEAINRRVGKQAQAPEQKKPRPSHLALVNQPK